MALDIRDTDLPSIVSKEAWEQEFCGHIFPIAPVLLGNPAKRARMSLVRIRT